MPKVPRNAKSLGYRDEMTKAQLKGKVIDAKTGAVYANKQDYLKNHIDDDGRKPTDPEIMGPTWDRIQKNALERGRQKTTKAKYDAAIKAIEERKKR